MRIFAALFCVALAACTNALPSLTLDAVSLSPDHGPIGGGNLVTITGTGLTHTRLVAFGDTASPSVVIVSDTTITAVAPPGTGSVPVLVYDAHLSGDALSYTYGAPPILDDLTPTHGAAGTSVTLLGARLTGATQVLFGAVPATSFLVTSDKQIVAVAPAGTGAQNITVVTRFGTSNGVGFGYDLGAPTLTTISPAMGPEAGGTTVTLTGTSFGGTSTVSFGGVPATNVQLVSETQVTAVSPAGTGVVGVTLTTSAGTTNAASFSYVPPMPTLVSVTPATASASGGALVTLSGTGLTGTTSVTFGGVAATSVNVVSDSSVTCIVPAYVSGSFVKDVTVSTGVGSATLTGGFTYE